MEASGLPRSQNRSMDGTDLTVVSVEANGDVVISDGVRTARYRPLDGPPLSGTVTILPHYVETGMHSEANAVMLTDGRVKSLYEPVP